jgi:hypothetical protein
MDIAGLWKQMIEMGRGEREANLPQARECESVPWSSYGSESDSHLFLQATALERKPYLLAFDKHCTTLFSRTGCVDLKYS